MQTVSLQIKRPSKAFKRSPQAWAPLLIKAPNTSQLPLRVLRQTDVTIGGANGTISVKGADVAVKGLGSAAYTESNAYAPYTLTETVNTNTTNIQTNAEAIDALLHALGDVQSRVSQLTAEEKNEISHRGVALRDFAAKLENYMKEN